jgi:hypothetical protein
MPKYTSQGTVIEVDIATVFTPVASCKSIDFPDGEAQYIDLTGLDSEHIEDGELAGLTAPGGAGTEVFYDPADAVHLLLANDPKLKPGDVDWPPYRDFRITLPDTGASVVTFTGSVKSFVPKAAAKEALMANLALRLRSPATYPA